MQKMYCQLILNSIEWTNQHDLDLSKTPVFIALLQWQLYLALNRIYRPISFLP